MEIDKMEFTFWMKRIMERFDLLSDQIGNNNRQLNTINSTCILNVS